MRQIIYVVVSVLILQVAATRADKVRFECDASLFESATQTGEKVDLFNYEYPLYEGLWPMTIEAFRRWECDGEDREVFTFNIAALDESSIRDSLWKATRERFATTRDEVLFGKFTR